MRHSNHTRTWLRELRDVYAAEKDQPRTRKKLLTTQIHICNSLIDLVNKNSTMDESQQVRIQRRIEEYAAYEGDLVMTPRSVAHEYRENMLLTIAGFLNTCKSS